MFVFKTILFFASAILVVSESKFVDTLNKCSINDGACQATLITNSLKFLERNGAPELGIPAIDPITFNDTTVTIMDLFQMTIYDGKVKGVKDCVVDSFVTDITKGHSEMKLSCNEIVIKAKYKLSGSNPLLKNLLGGESIEGEGKCKVKIEKVVINFDYFFDVEKNKDGDLFFNCKFNKTIYDYKVLGKSSFVVDKVYLGKTDATQTVLAFLNENDKFIVSTFGKPFFDIAMEYVYDYTHRFFTNVAAKYFIIEDLSPYEKQ